MRTILEKISNFLWKKLNNSALLMLLLHDKFQVNGLGNRNCSKKKIRITLELWNLFEKS